MRIKKETIVNITGLLLSAVAIFLSVRKIRWHEVLATLKTIDMHGAGLIAAASLILLLSFVIRSLMWRTIVNSGKDTPLGILQSFSIMMIGMLANNIFPAKIGEFVRAQILKEKTGISRSFSLGSIFVERFFDILLLFMILVAAILFFDAPVYMKKIAVMAFVLILTTIVIFFISHRMRGSPGRPAEDPENTPMKGKIGKAFSEKLSLFFKASHDLFAGRKILVVLLLSFSVWGLHITCLYLFALAIGIVLPFYRYFLIISVINFSYLLPSAPGGIGLYQYSTILAFGMYHVSRETALIYGVYTFFFTYALVFLLGLLCLYRERISFSSLIPQKK